MTVTSANTPFSTVRATGNSLVDALLDDSKWGGAMGSGVSLTFSFPGSNSLFASNYRDGEPFTGYGIFTNEQKAATRAILAEISRTANIGFIEVLDSGNSAGELRFALTQSISAPAHAYSPGSTAESGDVWVRNRTDEVSGVTPGSFNYMTLVHEIGHALGLKHPHEGSPTLPASWDSRSVTVMSYEGTPVPQAMTFLPLDILALQQIYGANTNHATGNDRYVVTGFGGGIRTVWDAGGIDTFDFSARSAGVFVSLLPGTVITGDTPYAIAYGTIIEYATMGAGNDSVAGNSAANWLQGNGGRDTLRGFEGADLLDGGFGNDLLTGGAGDDYLLGSYGRDVASYALPASAIAWQRNADGSVLVSTGGEGMDRLVHVEALQATDRLISLSQPLRRDFNGDSREDLVTQQAGTGNLTAFTWGVTGAAPSTVSRPAGATLLATADVNGDGSAELLWRLAGNAGLQFRALDGGSAPNLNDPGSGWTVRATGDFDGDTKADILWGSATGQTYIWLMDGTNGASRHGGFASPGAGWSVQGAGDFNGDGKSDILWRHTNGTVWTWLMDGVGILGGGGQSSPGAGWSIKGIGDLDGDAKSDIIWRHDSGMVWTWLMDGAIAARNGGIGNPGAEWDIAAVGDASGDGLADIIHRNTSGISWYWVMQGNAIAGAGFVAQQGTDWAFLS
jgi:Ca2+-binding RTX toxin-like protein